MSKKEYNKIEVKDNMKIERDDNNEEVAQKEKVKMDKIVSSEPKKVKRNLASRLIAGVLGPEGLPGIGSYVNDEIIKPAIKNIIFDAITSAASMAMFGERGGPTRGRGYSNGQRTTYSRPATNYSNRYSSRQPEPNQQHPSDRLVARSRHGVEEYIIEDRFDAAHILTSLTEYADRYDSVSVAEYYDAIGVPSQYTDNNYGWTIDTITRASIIPVRGGYVIKFPPVEVI